MNSESHDWGHGHRLTALGLSQFASQLNQAKSSAELKKIRQFKVCKKCGAICHISVNPCPATIGLNICKSEEFRLITLEEFKEIKNGKRDFWFTKWPEEI
jgi:hypothetical protein